MFDPGYRFNQKMLENEVSGYKKLTVSSRHCVRDILDLIWSSSNLSVDDDEILISYMGLTKRDWNKIKKEIQGVNNAFICLSNGVWYSNWLKRQKEISMKSQETKIDNQIQEQLKILIDGMKSQNVNENNTSPKLREMKNSSGSYFEKSKDIDNRIERKFLQGGEDE